MNNVLHAIFILFISYAMWVDSVSYVLACKLLIRCYLNAFIIADMGSIQFLNRNCLFKKNGIRIDKFGIEVFYI